MSSGPGQQHVQTKLIKPKTRRGRRILESRAAKLVENPRKALVLYGGRVSQIIKDALSNIDRLKGVDAIKFTRKNADIQPFEAGGEQPLEHHARKLDCSLFALGTHSKKRPHNLVLGRLYDHRLYDMVEFGVTSFVDLTSFKGATASQAGNKPCFVFVGDAFVHDPQLAQVRSLLLDFFRGREVDAVNLRGLDRVMFVTHVDKTVVLRQYSAAFKKSGTRIPRVELTEMGPSLDLQMRRARSAPADLEKEATKRPKVTKKKEKNVSLESLDGKVGRIYMPKQDVDTISLAKMKGLKRERRQSAADAGAAPKKVKST